MKTKDKIILTVDSKDNAQQIIDVTDSYNSFLEAYKKICIEENTMSEYYEFIEG